MSRLLASAIVFSLLLGGCRQAAQSLKQTLEPSAQASTTLTVSAAASLTHVMEEIEELYQQQQPKTDITYNFASSGSLQQQIEQGAPVDVFFSAAAKQMNELEAKQMLKQDSRQDLLENQIVLVVPADAKNISSFEDLKRDRIQKIAIGEPGSVPAGKYAQEVLTNLKILEQLKAKTIFAKNVRQVLTYVETGNVDAGIVYATDAQKSEGVKIVAVAPKTSHSPVIYPIAIVKEAQNSDASEDFVEFLASQTAGVVFKKHGFSLTSESAQTALPK